VVAVSLALAWVATGELMHEIDRLIDGYAPGDSLIEEGEGAFARTLKLVASSAVKNAQKKEVATKAASKRAHGTIDGFARDAPKLNRLNKVIMASSSKEEGVKKEIKQKEVVERGEKEKQQKRVQKAAEQGEKAKEKEEKAKALAAKMAERAQKAKDEKEQKVLQAKEEAAKEKTAKEEAIIQAKKAEEARIQAQERSEKKEVADKKVKETAVKQERPNKKKKALADTAEGQKIIANVKTKMDKAKEYLEMRRQKDGSSDESDFEGSSDDEGVDAY
jgi:hypothetical protein